MDVAGLVASTDGANSDGQFIRLGCLAPLLAKPPSGVARVCVEGADVTVDTVLRCVTCSHFPLESRLKLCANENLRIVLAPSLLDNRFLCDVAIETSNHVCPEVPEFL